MFDCQGCHCIGLVGVSKTIQLKNRLLFSIGFPLSLYKPVYGIKIALPFIKNPERGHP
jgi:hypothetical protein